MILFCGLPNVGHFVAEIAGVDESDIKYTGNISHVADLEAIILECPYTNIMIDITKFTDMPDTVCSEICRIQQVCNTPFIFFALGYSEQSELVSRLIEHDFYYFILDPRPTEAKNQLKTALNGYATVTKLESSPAEDIATDAQTDGTLTVKSIGVAGCCHRIGTTTQALQICKYLQLKQHRPCYINLSSGKDIEIWREILSDIENTKEDDLLHRLRYANIDMYASAEFIADIKAMDYDYLVYDFGDIHNDRFNMIQFMEKDIRIIVSGIKPAEMYAMQDVYNAIAGKTAYYIFSFISDADKKDVLDMQSVLAERTQFASWAPDPFVYTSKSTPIYDSILSVTGGDEMRKKGFFKKFHGGKKR